jgi:hypothetical protein
VIEISEGITKPVEKPIPKPLPPTVSLETGETAPTRKRTIEEILKSQLLNAQASLNQAINSSNNIEKNQPEFDLANTNSPSSSNQPAFSTSIATSPTNSTTSNRNSTNPYSSTPSRVSTNASSYQNKRFKQFHQNRSFPGPNPPNPPFFQNQNNNLMYNNQHSSMPRYALNTLNPYQYPPQAPVYHQQPQQQITYSHPHAYNHPQLTYTAYNTPAASSSSSTISYYNTVPQTSIALVSQQSNVYESQTSFQNSSKSTNSIKNEPIEPSVLSPIKANQPYFTNPIPFKQEPREANEQGNSGGNADTALNLVNHLLKDQQILSQLEKVAQSFKL